MEQSRVESTLSSPLPSPLPRQKAARPDTHSQRRLVERGPPDNTRGTQWPGAQSFTETLINHVFVPSFLSFNHRVPPEPTQDTPARQEGLGGP